MRLLLDTHVLLWALGDPARLDSMAEPARLYTVDPLLPPYSEMVELIG